ncbi:hypothetical protein [Nocardia arizonensis]|uniref:hypothetical protein n=1 Tax=Nocardia arizonensis TaxID=1141647 RepID=UPI0006D1C322|nr:hypothetical protein [Nocardia arizonensis]
MSGKEIIEPIEFEGAQVPLRYTKAEEGQLVTPGFLALMQHLLSGRSQEPPANESLESGVELSAEELSVIHLPAWQRWAGDTAEPTVTGIKQATRSRNISKAVSGARSTYAWSRIRGVTKSEVYAGRLAQLRRRIDQAHQDWSGRDTFGAGGGYVFVADTERNCRGSDVDS